MTLRSQEENKQVLSVDEVAFRVKKMLEYDPLLSNLTVEGELSDLKRHSSGHVYFMLKGAKASVPCVMFRSDAAGMLLWPRVGDRVILQGRVDLYAERGTVQVYARKMFPLGVGAAARAKEELRLKLEKEGLFSDMRKRPLPPYPRRAVCVTSPTGAAVRDVINVFRRRYPSAELVVVPCLVQGLQAPESIAAALRRAGAVPGAEVILLVRGGGSREDLNPFDDEELVREVARSPLPLVSGVGHEVDWSLCDMAADLRVPTPTAAAESVFPDRKGVLDALRGAEDRLAAALASRCGLLASKVASLESGITRSCLRFIRSGMQTADSLEEQLNVRCKRSLRESELRLNHLERSLLGLSPQSICARGYALCLSGAAPVTSVKQIKAAGRLTVQLIDGDATCSIEHITEKEKIS